MSIIIYTLRIAEGQSSGVDEVITGRLLNIKDYLYGWIIVMHFMGEIT